MGQNDENDFHGFGKPPVPNDHDSDVEPNFDSDLPNFDEEEELDEPVLSDSLPSLSRGSTSGLNKKALAFLAVTGIFVLGGLVLAYKALTGPSDKDVQVQKTEEVLVADRPSNTPPPLYPQTEEPLPLELNDPLDIASEPVGANNRNMQLDQYPSLAEKRVMGNSGSVVNGNQGGQAGMGGTMSDMGSMIPGVQSPAGDGYGGMNFDSGMASLNTLYGGEGSQVNKKPDVRRINNMDTVMLRGTYIRCILETKIVSTLAGPVGCVVTNPIYSASGKKLLIPRGSKVLGAYESDTTDLNDRVAVIWDRIITPNGIDINLSGRGMDQIGSVGHPGKRRAYWGQRLGAALLVSLTADVFNYAAYTYVPKMKRTYMQDGAVIQEEQPFNSKAADAIAQMPDKILDRTLNKPATVTINQGTLLNIYAEKDIDFATVLD